MQEVSRRVGALSLVLALSLAACVPVRWDDSGTKTPAASGAATQSDTTPQARSKRGNPPFYEVYGKRYYVLDSSDGHVERGVASWYGKKFHGRPTSSGVIYDMNKMTAAHKTLPLPTVVRVTHLGNGRSIIVTVNDRGPFVGNRIIDLSYAAAKRLDMIGTGTALVEVEALTGPAVEPRPVQTAGTLPVLTEAPTAGERLFLQVGAFGDPINARALQRQLETKGLSNVVIRYDAATSPTLYRVRLGPIADVAEYDALVQLVGSMNIAETHLVTESRDTDLQDLAITSPTGIVPGPSAVEAPAGG